MTTLILARRKVSLIVYRDECLTIKYGLFLIEILQRLRVNYPQLLLRYLSIHCLSLKPY